MANNHMGQVSHGLRIIEEVHKITQEFDFNFAFKLQYRQLGTFIHPAYKDRKDLKYIKRFIETRLDENDFKKLKSRIQELGFLSICTAFDEISVDKIEEHGYDILKIGSCSFTDWPLLERIGKVNLPILASTAGVATDDIDKVVSFFEHRNKNISLMHCVAEYPTEMKNLQLNQIDFLRTRYLQIRIGFSTHEDPSNNQVIKIAVAKGVTIFEKHVGVPTDSISLNAYSATPKQVHEWLHSAKEAYAMCGMTGERHNSTQKELNDLHGLRRGVFAKTPLRKGDKIDLSNVFLSIPVDEGQLSANDLSKYTEFHLSEHVAQDEPIYFDQVKRVELREKVLNIVDKVSHLILESKVPVPPKLDFEISHHHGIDRFFEFGATIINFINREYCKKLIIMLPGQVHPEQYHKLKEETFHILYGNLIVILDGKEKECNEGDILIIERGIKHKILAKTGVVIEEISSTHYKDDSYYMDENILKNGNRKTLITYRLK